MKHCMYVFFIHFRFQNINQVNKVNCNWTPKICIQLICDAYETLCIKLNRNVIQIIRYYTHGLMDGVTVNRHSVLINKKTKTQNIFLNQYISSQRSHLTRIEEQKHRMNVWYHTIGTSLLLCTYSRHIADGHALGSLLLQLGLHLRLPFQWEQAFPL